MCTVHQLSRPLFLWHIKITSLQQDGISDRPHNLPLVSQDFGGLLSCKLVRLLDPALAIKRPEIWQKGRLVVVFCNVFSAVLFNWNFMPVSCHLLPLPLHDF